MKFQLMLLLISSSSCCIILNTKEGYEVGKSTSNIQFDVFYDVHCPNSADFYKVVQDVLNSKIKDETISNLISFKIHIFPLPFHHNSFYASIGQKFIEKNYPNQFL